MNREWFVRRFIATLIVCVIALLFYGSNPDSYRPGNERKPVADSESSPDVYALTPPDETAEGL